ncbi:putative serine threonine-kinase [Clavispora lusitaniae]|uniref:non-specific serine/threonine protein kinase n=2 Tax=Clavispora lusitaniae TaxID=36911 RepID=C4XYG7_CLAL4|nr:uncharacterized protein CLUG_00990 [Clavispora lusitaniae ATCC 42720]KAF5212687.1 hypothetical protein E0198_000186 [Clavispora lusitaniae]EEQ36867.1 hypothetical protein CLUG_00990 [Clavispora lusitaniae ATCC 42720]KAF7584863.1 Protein kinase domain family protein [Clavispora lusitaniae]QFZ25899.1 putative serine threonine-kinase [Clavispora lusitaniae]QFZ30798.1 putative serine threonine-kinase [Clavispora lusitaniae]
MPHYHPMKTPNVMDLILNSISKCFPCCPDISSPQISVNGTKYKIIRLLGEGGFSYVYLVSQKNNASILYAMKKIRCPYGSSDATFRNAMREIKSYHRFAPAKSPYIVHTIDEAIVSEPDGSRTFYVLLPYFKHSLQDIINYNVLNGVTMDEEEVLKIFIGVLSGIQTMHKYKKTGSDPGEEDSQNEQDAMLPMGLDDDTGAMESTEMSELCPYAHRDIKPANVMLSAEGLPVLVDLGSCMKARVSVKSRQQALALTDFASEHCTLPYRAPELLDVATNAEITEATDIWSLGCLLYCCCFGFSPFEKLEMEQGANLSVAIAQAKYNIPQDIKGYSPEIMDIIRSCLQLDPTKRPTVDELLEKCLALQGM